MRGGWVSIFLFFFSAVTALAAIRNFFESGFEAERTSPVGGGS